MLKEEVNMKGIINVIKNKINDRKKAIQKIEENGNKYIQTKETKRKKEE